MVCGFATRSSGTGLRRNARRDHMARSAALGGKLPSRRARPAGATDDGAGNFEVQHVRPTRWVPLGGPNRRLGAEWVSGSAAPW